MVDVICVASNISKGDYGCTVAEVRCIGTVVANRVIAQHRSDKQFLVTAVCISCNCAVMVWSFSEKSRHFCCSCGTLQICGGDWAKHNTETGGYFRCNINPPLPDATSAGDDSSSSQPVDAMSTQDGSSSSQPGAGLLGVLFGKVTNAGAKWKLDYFMRRFLAHECSHRQLQVHSALQFDRHCGIFSADY